MIKRRSLILAVIVAAIYAATITYNHFTIGDVSKMDRPLKFLISSNSKRPYNEESVAEVLSTFNAAVLGQLLKVNNELEIEPGLLKRWSWDFNKSCYQLVLQDGLKFHNGRDVTSVDLEFSLLRGFFSKRRSFFSVYLGNIRGIETAAEGVSFKSGIVNGIKIIDGQTIEVYLSKPNPAFLYSLTNPYFSLRPSEEMSDDYVSWKDLPIGAGPYRVTGSTNSVTSLTRVNREKHTVNDIVLYTEDNKSTDGTYDISLLEPKTNLPHYAKHASTLPVSIWSIFFTNNSELGANPEFRKAVDLAIDRGAIAGLDQFSKASFELLPSHFWGRADLPNRYDPSLAKQIIQGLPKSLVQRTWRVPVFSSGAFSVEKAERLRRLQAQLSAVGLRFEFYASSEKFLSEETASSAPIKLSGRVTDYIDPLLMFASLKSSSPYRFERPTDDSILERLFHEASEAASQISRFESVRALSKYVGEKHYVVPILEDKLLFYLRKDVKFTLGNQPQPLTIFIENLRAN